MMTAATELMTGLVVHEVLAGLLFWSCFCRAVKMSKRTHNAVRLAFWAESIAAVVVVFAPLRGWQPDAITNILLIGVTTVQLVTAYYWQHGVPAPFQKPAPPAAQQAHAAAHS
jgi:hypothetical protein